MRVFSSRPIQTAVCVTTHKHVCTYRQRYRQRKTQGNFPHCYEASRNTKPRDSILHRSRVVSQYQPAPPLSDISAGKKRAPAVHPGSEWEEHTLGMPIGIHILSWVKITSLSPRGKLIFLCKHNRKTRHPKYAVFHRALNHFYHNLKFNSSMGNWKKKKKQNWK